MSAGAAVRAQTQDLSAVVDLADEYAEQIIKSLPTMRSEAELKTCLAGTLLAFLAEALLLVANE
jgi:hypothetical protein